jgi:hypothetical protein
MVVRLAPTAGIHFSRTGDLAYAGRSRADHPVFAGSPDLATV